MFSTRSKTDIITLATFDLSSAIALNLVQSKKLSFGTELKVLSKCLEKVSIIRNTKGPFI